MVLVGVRYFCQPVDEKMQTWPLRSRAKENANVEKALFDWPIVLPYDVKAKYRLISRKFSATHVCIHLINQSNRSIQSFKLSLGQQMTSRLQPD